MSANASSDDDTSADDPWEVVERQHEETIQLLTVSQPLLDHLQGADMLDPPLVQVLSSPTHQEKATVLINALQIAGQKGFDAFCEALQTTNQTQLLEKLSVTQQPPEKPPDAPVVSKHSTSPAAEGPPRFVDWMIAITQLEKLIAGHQWPFATSLATVSPMPRLSGAPNQQGSQLRRAVMQSASYLLDKLNISIWSQNPQRIQSILPAVLYSHVMSLAKSGDQQAATSAFFPWLVNADDKAVNEFFNALHDVQPEVSSRIRKMSQQGPISSVPVSKPSEFAVSTQGHETSCHNELVLLFPDTSVQVKWGDNLQSQQSSVVTALRDAGVVAHEIGSIEPCRSAIGLEWKKAPGSGAGKRPAMTLFSAVCKSPDLSEEAVAQFLADLLRCTSSLVFVRYLTSRATPHGVPVLIKLPLDVAVEFFWLLLEPMGVLEKLSFCHVEPFCQSFSANLHRGTPGGTLQLCHALERKTGADSKATPVSRAKLASVAPGVRVSSPAQVFSGGEAISLGERFDQHDGSASANVASFSDMPSHDPVREFKENELVCIRFFTFVPEELRTDLKKVSLQVHFTSRSTGTETRFDIPLRNADSKGIWVAERGPQKVPRDCRVAVLLNPSVMVVRIRRGEGDGREIDNHLSLRSDGFPLSQYLRTWKEDLIISCLIPFYAQQLFKKHERTSPDVVIHQLWSRALIDYFLLFIRRITPEQLSTLVSVVLFAERADAASLSGDEQEKISNDINKLCASELNVEQSLFLAVIWSTLWQHWLQNLEQLPHLPTEFQHHLVQSINEKGNKLPTPAKETLRNFITARGLSLPWIFHLCNLNFLKLDGRQSFAKELPTPPDMKALCHWLNNVGTKCCLSNVQASSCLKRLNKELPLRKSHPIRYLRVCQKLFERSPNCESHLKQLVDEIRKGALGAQDVAIALSLIAPVGASEKAYDAYITRREATRLMSATSSQAILHFLLEAASCATSENLFCELLNTEQARMVPESDVIPLCEKWVVGDLVSLTLNATDPLVHSCKRLNTLVALPMIYGNDALRSTIIASVKPKIRKLSPSIPQVFQVAHEIERCSPEVQGVFCKVIQDVMLEVKWQDNHSMESLSAICGGDPEGTISKPCITSKHR